MIIWDKGFTRPVEEQTTEEDEDIVFSSSFVLDALEDIEEPVEGKQKTAKGFGK